MTRKRVLVAGATGRLGVIVDVLLERGHSVRGVTRDPTSPAATRVRAGGAEVVYGRLRRSWQHRSRCDGRGGPMFATGTVHQAGPQGELRHGRNLAGAAVAAGVPHLIYSSGDGVAPDSPLPALSGQAPVEEHIRSLPIGHTILASVYFMDNLFSPWNLPMLHAGAFPSPIPVELPMQQVAIASDELTAEQAADALSRELARDFNSEQLPSQGLAPGLRALITWLEHNRQNVDLVALHGRYPDVGWHNYEAWVRSQNARLHGLWPREHAGVR